jgi:hypothetical protein
VGEAPSATPTGRKKEMQRTTIRSLGTMHLLDL